MRNHVPYFGLILSNSNYLSRVNSQNIWQLEFFCKKIGLWFILSIFCKLLIEIIYVSITALFHDY